MPYPYAGDLDAANTALLRISERTISSFTENSAAARAVNLIYPKTRNMLLSALDWRFATARAVLGTQSAGVYPWAYQYFLPTNCIRPRMVLPQVQQGDAAPFEEGTALFTDGSGEATRVLWTDLSAPVLVYTAIVPDPGQWDYGFLSVFTLQLAAELCLPVTGNGQLANEMRQAAQAAMAAMSPVGQAQSITPQSRGPSTTTAARSN